MYCGATYAQNKMFKIQYGPALSTELGAQQPEEASETVFEGWVNKDLIRFYTHGDYPTIQLTKKATGQSTILYPSQELYHILIGENEAVANAATEDIKLEYIPGKQKNIAGYICKLAQFDLGISEDTNEPSVLEFWYTEAIPTIYWGDYDFLRQLPGAVLEMSIGGTGIIANKISQDELKNEEFEIPVDYTEAQPAADIADDTTELAEGIHSYYNDDNTLIGLRDADDNIITEAIFTSIATFNGDTGIASDGNYNYGTIDKQGKTVFPFNYSYLAFDEDSQQYLFGKGELFGLMDKSGKEIIQPKYNMISFLKNGYSTFQKDEKNGMLDAQGKEVVPAQYSYIADHTATHFIAVEGETYSLHTIKGQKSVITGLQHISITDEPNIFLALKGDKYGFLDQDGKVLIPFKYAYATIFTDGVATVSLDADLTDIFMIDTKGQPVAAAEAE